MNISTLGIRTQEASKFYKKGIYEIEDLVRFLPRKYIDYSSPKLIKDVVDGEDCSIIAKVIEVKYVKGSYVRVKVQDKANWKMNITWFNQDYVSKLLREGFEYIFCGKVKIDTTYNSRQMTSPLFSMDKTKYQRILPIYSKVPNVSDNFLEKCMNSAVALANKAEYLEPAIMKEFNLISTRDTIRNIHQPKSLMDVKEAKKRLLFDDMFAFALKLKKQGNGAGKELPYTITSSKKAVEYIQNLPFDLTDGQKSTIRDIFSKMKQLKKVDALVQADVGSGKTVIAFILQLIVAENGYQSTLMAPTTVLAKQHYQELLVGAKNLGYEVALLTSETGKRERRKILEGLKNGSIQLLVGTHSILSEDVVFNNLALSIIDEEHKFGVSQREVLETKSEYGVHNIIMSATPIPRTLAMTIHGSHVDIYDIKSRPKGRKPIETIYSQKEEEVYEFMYSEIEKGRQCYVVCPLVDTSEKMENVDTVKNTYDKLIKYFKDRNVNIGMVYGKDKKQSEIDMEIRRFTNNEYQILVSTTVVEVGVNVPNSTVILIKNAERFGLAQLHQLRGRVGRSEHQSYCVLLSEKKDKKIEVMCRTCNGFEIAQADLAIRGAGDFIGTKQTGDNKYVMQMLSYPNKFKQVQGLIDRLWDDPVKSRKYGNLIEKILA